MERVHFTITLRSLQPSRPRLTSGYRKLLRILVRPDSSVQDQLEIVGGKFITPAGHTLSSLLPGESI